MMIYLSPTLGFCLIFMSKLGTQGSTSVGNFPRILRLIIISSLCSLCRLINFHSLKDVDIKRRNYCHRTSNKYNKIPRTADVRSFYFSRIIKKIFDTCKAEPRKFTQKMSSGQMDRNKLVQLK